MNEDFDLVSDFWRRVTMVYSCRAVEILYDFLITVKAAPHECVIRTGLP